MATIGTIVTFLLGACVGLLVGLFLQGGQRIELAKQALLQEKMLAKQAREQAQMLAEQAANLAAEQHAETRAQRATLFAALHGQITLTGAALAAQIQETAAEHRNDLRLAQRLPPLTRPGEHARHVSSGSTDLPSVLNPHGSGSTLLRVGDDEATPPSGWSPEMIRAKHQQAEQTQP
ncbi:MAG: hypothetical protein IPK82_08125 [Polyangiaceae bacterium]|nr:hypothetical protein [Polyangiaceae bacterium]